MPASENGSYQVHCSKVVADRLRQLQRLATPRGQGEAFLAAFRGIVRALRKNPNAVGEPLYRLPALHLQVRAVVVLPLAIDFAVSEDHPLVCIRRGKLLTAQNS